MAALLRRTFLMSSLLALSVGCSVESKPSTSGTPSLSGNGKSATNETGGASAAADPADKLNGEVVADGSSTVYPITQAVAEEFMKVHKDVKVSVGIAGTGGGFKRFVVGDTDINDASRPISEKEIAECQKNGIEYLELKVAIDGLSVVVHPDNTWCRALTIPQLKSLWSPGSTVKKWKELDPNWPDAEIRLYGAGPDSGTFDYFTEAVVGKAKSSRSDYTPSEDDNVLVQGVNGDKNSLGYFGYAYYADNSDKVKLVAIADGDDVSKAVIPTNETILGGTYKPLSRPLFIYINKKSFEKPQVKEFVKYFISKGQEFVQEVHYIQLPENDLKESQKRLAAALGSK
ncbi:MAG: PstS family phosphate ABC transporter substrate-binding protein [Planctomycetes bacterium]|nr:PstS family phosphate ABC transporter substrate-binding protein [Planctomycetota bacterium]